MKKFKKQILVEIESKTENFQEDKPVNVIFTFPEITTEHILNISDSEAMGALIKAILSMVKGGVK